MKTISQFKYFLILFMILIAGLNETFSQSVKKATPSEVVQSTRINKVTPLKIDNYEFTDSLDNKVSLSDFKGRFILIDVWFTGCGACISVNQGLKTVHDSLKNKNIVFLSISVDKNKELWLQSVRSDTTKTRLNYWAGRYAPAKGTIILYTGGNGMSNTFIKTHVLKGYPQLLLIDPKGNLISPNPPRPDYEPLKLINHIKQFL